MQRVIALDIGSYSIKAVEILNTLKSYEIVNFYENVIPHLDGVDVDAVAPSCMEQLFQENKLTADRIVTAMPGQFISSRVVSLGFSEPRKVHAAVMAEVQDAVPFNLDEMIVDHQILGSVGGKTMALAVMTRKAFLRNFLDLLQRVNIDPKLVDVDSLAFYNLSSFMKTKPHECFAMVDVGHEKTSVCVVQDGVLRMFRSINLGGRYITEFLARDLEIGFNEAQRIKHQVSQVLCEEDDASNLSRDERMVVERMTLATNAIIKELGRTIYAFKTWEKVPISQMYLSGGTSKIKNFDRFIHDQLEVKTKFCRLDETDLKIKAELNESMTVMPQSVAIGIRTVSSVRKHSQINLRTGEFAYVQNYESILRFAYRAARIASAAVALLILSYVVKYAFYQKHIDRLNAQYRKEFSEITIPNKRIDANAPFAKFSQDASRLLKTRINDMKTGVDLFKLENTSRGPLALLKEISEAIPKDVKLDVTLYELKQGDTGDARLTLRAETDNYALQAKIIDLLKQVPSLANVTERQSGAKPGSNGKIIEFTVVADYPRIMDKG